MPSTKPRWLHHQVTEMSVEPTETPLAPDCASRRLRADTGCWNLGR